MVVQLDTLRAQWRIIGVATLVGAVLAFTIVALVPAKFQTDIQILVVQDQRAEKADTSAAMRLTTYFTHVMANAVHTTSFFTKVQEAPFAVRKDFSTDPIVRKKQWASAVRVETREEAGMIQISVRDTSRTTAEATANGIAYVLTTKNHDYRGANDGVVVRMIDGPTTPLAPTLPRIAPWTVFGGVVGCVIGVMVILFFPSLLPPARKVQPSVRGVRHDDEIQADLTFVQRRDDDPVSTAAINTHFQHVAQRHELRNLPVVDQTLFGVEAHGDVSNDSDAVDNAESDAVENSTVEDAELINLYAQIDAFHKNNP